MSWCVFGVGCPALLGRMFAWQGEGREGSDKWWTSRSGVTPMNNPRFADLDCESKNMVSIVWPVCPEQAFQFIAPDGQWLPSSLASGSVVACWTCLTCLDLLADAPGPTTYRGDPSAWYVWLKELTQLQHLGLYLAAGCPLPAALLPPSLVSLRLVAQADNMGLVPLLEEEGVAAAGGAAGAGQPGQEGVSSYQARVLPQLQLLQLLQPDGSSGKPSSEAARKVLFALGPAVLRDLRCFVWRAVLQVGAKRAGNKRQASRHPLAEDLLLPTLAVCAQVYRMFCGTKRKVSYLLVTCWCILPQSTARTLHVTIFSLPRCLFSAAWARTDKTQLQHVLHLYSRWCALAWSGCI